MKKILKYAWVGVVILLMVQVFIERYFHLKLIIFKLNSVFISLLLIISIIVLPMFIFHYNKYKIIKIIYNIIGSILIVFMCFIYLFACSGNKYFQFKSPYDDKVLVVEETSFLLFGGSNFYQKKYIIFMESIGGSISTDDGYRPFSHNQYNIKWVDENTVEINYDFGSGGIWEKEVIHM